MDTSCPKHLFTKAFKNSILIFSILLLSLTLSFAQDGRDSIQLPPLRNDAEKLAVLLQIKEKVPNLFSDSIKYDIDLFALLEDEEKLLNYLKSDPKYVELFQHKKYHEIQITPPREGLQIGELSIDPKALQEWRERLKKTLNQFKLRQGSGDENTHPMEFLRGEITAKVQSIAGANSSVDGNTLLRELGGTKANQAILNPASNGIKTLSERLSKALEVYKALPNKPSHAFQEKLVQALKLEQDREDLQSLIEIHSALNRPGQNEDPAHHTWQTAEASLNELQSGDLITFQDKEDYLRPILNHLIPSSHSEIQENMLNRIHKTISSFANRTISSEKKAKEPVTISQQQPIVGIFRGCAGGDCSSRLSFPYPNDPNEKVFFIFDKDKTVKGYVNATQVMASGKPSLYVITISGNRVTSADAELILRGFEKEKET